MSAPDRTQGNADCQSDVSRIGNPQAPGGQDESTGLPWFRTWRGVYWSVFGCFVFCVVLLTIFSWAFS